MSIDNNAPLSVTIPSDPHTRKLIRDTLKDISNLKTMMAAQADTIKEAIKGASERHDIPKKYMERMVNVFHAGTYEKQEQEHDEFTTLYESIVEGN